ncbi:MAG: TonB-dependent receptor, partial [Halieaceae bacterium]|nr:TonB-dependent receptor [Halieaceae bacterium]
ERQEVEADGPSAQNYTNGSGVDGFWANYDRNSFDFSIDNPGAFELEVDYLNVQFSWDVAGGTVTNVFGYRESYSETNADIDAQPVWIFHSDTASSYDQWSNELRWNGLLLDDRLNLTTGLYMFESELNYDEDRNLLGAALVGTPGEGRPALTQNGGGELDVQSLGLFMSGDYNITDNLIFTAGIRWSREEKDASITTLSRVPVGEFAGAPGGVNSECFIPGTAPNISYTDRESACVPDFVDGKRWSFVSPKVGFMYDIDAGSRIYANWSRGFRSGGYNLRNTEFPIVFGPGPFDIEQADSFEIGYKAEWDGGQFNLAVFQTNGKDMQREVNLPSETAGVLQLIQNTADVELFGLEADGTFAITDSFTLKASMGWMSNKYTDVTFDLNGDGVVNGDDRDLKLPRAPDLTYSVTAIHDADFGDAGYLTSRLTYAYRDLTFYTDNNLGDINDQEMLDGALDFHTADGHWIFSFYGRNLLNSVLHGGATQLPGALGGFPTGGTFAPLNRPRTFGIEASYKL